MLKPREAPAKQINPMIDAAAVAICKTAHAQADMPHCFDEFDEGGPARVEPCEGCRAQALAAIVAFIRRGAIVGMRHDGLDGRDLGHVGAVFEQADQQA